MIYFMIIASIIVADKILKEYFKSSFQGKHREVRTKGNGFGVRKEVGKQKVKENLFRKKEQNKAELKQRRNNKEKNDGKNIGEGNWREYLSPTIELLENKGAASGIMAKHPKILKIRKASIINEPEIIGTVVVIQDITDIKKERQKGKTTMTGIGYALLLGGGISNFIDRMKKGSVTDYVRFPKFPVKKISELVFNLSDFGIFAGVFCLLLRKK